MWKTVKLKDVITYEKVNGQGSSLPYVGMENISSDTMQIVGELEIPTSTSSTFKFDNAHVLYGRLRPYLKKVLVPNFKGQCSTEVFCLKPSSSLNRKFLAYWLLSPKISDKIENTSTGARMPRANMNAILEFDFVLPPLAEQQRIVAKLDAAFAEIDEAIELANSRKFQSEQLLQKMLAMEFCSTPARKSIKFANVCTLQRGFDLPKSQRKAGCFPLFSANGITDYIDTAKIAAPGVITGRSGTIGAVHYTDTEFWALNTALYVKDFKGNLPKYIFYFLKSFDLKKYASGAGVPTLNRNVLSDEVVWIAEEHSEQVRTCEKLDDATEQVSRLNQLLGKQIVNYEALKSAILADELKSEAA